MCPISALPTYKLNLDHVQSFRGHDTRHSLFYTASGALAFMACGIVVVQQGNDTRETPRQRHFCEHQCEVTCLTMHPNGNFIATADRGPTSVIFVWDSSDYDENTKKFKNKLNKFGDDPIKLAGTLVQGKTLADVVGISHICFGGPEGKWLFALGLSEGCPLTMYDWRASVLLCTASTNSSKFHHLSISCNPIDGYNLVTCGVKHANEDPLKFWTISKGGGSMVSEKADFGERVVTRTMCCIEFLVLGAYSICLTGAIDGCIFLWKNGQLLHIVKDAHEGSILDFAFDASNFLLYSGGRDGILRSWSVDDHSGMLKERSKTLPVQSASCNRCGFYTSAPQMGAAPEMPSLCPNCNKSDLADIPDGVSCIRSLAVKGQLVAVGTSLNQIILVAPESVNLGSQEHATVPKEMRVLLSSHGKGAVSAVEYHPLQPSIVYTVGDDCILRMWNTKEKRHMLAIRLEESMTKEDRKPGKLEGVTTSALHVSRDGKFLAVGFSNGHLALLDCSAVEEKVMIRKSGESDEFRFLKKAGGHGITCLRFGACDKENRLAAGTGDGTIYVFQEDDKGEMYLACSCKGHAGRVLSIDWSEDGRMMQSTSSEYELFFWRLEALRTAAESIPDHVSFIERERLQRSKLRCKLQRPGTCCDVPWPEWTSHLGWWVQGLRKMYADENSVCSAHAPQHSVLCVSGDGNGHVSMMPFPCSEASPVLYQTRVQAGAIKCVRLSPYDTAAAEPGEDVLAALLASSSTLSCLDLFNSFLP
jgi:WD40 repeat protein